MSDKLQIEGKEISIRQVNEKDYISLTDIAKQRNSSTSDNIIRSWLGNRDTEDFLELWESLHNPDFNPIQMNGFKDFRQREKRQASIKEYIEKTGAIGIISKSGRYGGTFAHSDIAFEFASWLSPVFKLRMIIDAKDELKSFIVFERDGNQYTYTISDFEETTVADNYFDYFEGKFDAYKQSDSDVIDVVDFTY